MHEVKLCSCTIKVLRAALESGDCCSKALATRLGMTATAVDQQFCEAIRALSADSRGGAILKAARLGLLRPCRLIMEDDTNEAPLTDR